MNKRILLLVISLLLIFSIGAMAKASSHENSDTVYPSDVEYLGATPGNRKVRLKWSRATDNVGVVAYKIYIGTKAVTEAGGLYDLPYITLGNKTSYTVKNLKNGRCYHFSVTALDAAGNESESYAVEAVTRPTKYPSRKPRFCK